MSQDSLLWWTEWLLVLFFPREKISFQQISESVRLWGVTSINRALYCTVHRNELSSLALRRGSASFIASTFLRLYFFPGTTAETGKILKRRCFLGSRYPKVASRRSQNRTPMSSNASNISCNLGPHNARILPFSFPFLWCSSPKPRHWICPRISQNAVDWCCF